MTSSSNRPSGVFRPLLSSVGRHCDWAATTDQLLPPTCDGQFKHSTAAASFVTLESCSAPFQVTTHLEFRRGSPFDFAKTSAFVTLHRTWYSSPSLLLCVSPNVLLSNDLRGLRTRRHGIAQPVHQRTLHQELLPRGCQQRTQTHQLANLWSMGPLHSPSSSDECFPRRRCLGKCSQGRDQGR